MDEHTAPVKELDLSRVIAISGHDGVGKSTLARELATHLGGVIISLADPLKHQTALHLGLAEVLVRAKPTPPHLRDYMRALGYAQRQENGEHYWVNQWYARALNALRDGASWVICDDVRHLNEFEFMDSHGAVSVALARFDAEPDITVSQPPIISEVWGIRFEIIRRAVTGGPFPSATTLMALAYQDKYTVDDSCHLHTAGFLPSLLGFMTAEGLLS
jgi:hypothetical protein